MLGCFSADRSFDYLFEKWKLQYKLIPQVEFTEDVIVVCRDGATSQPAHEILLMIITSC